MKKAYFDKKGRLCYKDKPPKLYAGDCSIQFKCRQKCPYLRIKSDAIYGREFIRCDRLDIAIAELVEKPETDSKK